MIKTFNTLGYIVLLSFLIVAISCSQQETIDYPLKHNKFEKLTTYQELTSFLEKISRANNNINVEYRGKTSEGYEIPVVYVQSGKGSSTNKIEILLLAQQHGDEPSGKEAILAFLAEVAQSGSPDFLDKLNLIIFPQLNPWGGDNDKRRNSCGFDLNRDHLVLVTPENQIVHSIFQGAEPHVTVDIHEFDPYYKQWEEFGYYKNADIQLGGPTNPNIDTNLISMFEGELLPFVKRKVENAGYKFLEYTIGQIYNSKGRLRHSTTHIDDGRQSFGIMHSLSIIIEGKYGRNSIDNIKERTLSQLVTIKAIVDFCQKNVDEIKTSVQAARENLCQPKSGEYLGVRFAHIQNGEKLAYPLYSIADKKDTVFMVDRYYPERKSTLKIRRPHAYLIHKSDRKLRNWVNRSGITTHVYTPWENDKIVRYKIIGRKDTTCNEGWLYKNVRVAKEKYRAQASENTLLMVPLDQLASNKISLAFEPESMLALHNDTAFHYILNDDIYPIYRLERKE